MKNLKFDFWNLKISFVNKLIILAALITLFTSLLLMIHLLLLLQLFIILIVKLISVNLNGHLTASYRIRCTHSCCLCRPISVLSSASHCSCTRCHHPCSWPRRCSGHHKANPSDDLYRKAYMSLLALYFCDLKQENVNTKWIKNDLLEYGP